MNRGTDSGNLAEIEFVKLFNKEKMSWKFKDYIDNFNEYHIENLYMTRVTTKQYSQLSNQVVMTRADTYLINSANVTIDSVLRENDYYLDENILHSNSIEYLPIEYSGVSVKMSDSDRFQIIKLTPDSFYKLFKEYELGAAASMYCLKEEELSKNDMLCIGWHTTKQKIVEKYCTEMPSLTVLLNKDLSKFDEMMILKELKYFANKKIAEIINNNKHMQEIIFNGYHIYKEPYSASFFYKEDVIKKLNYIPFWVTTGSGRSKGNYTIVLKPKNETIK